MGNKLAGWCLLILLAGRVVLAAELTEAEKAIPFESLTAANRALAQAVTEHYTVRRDYPVRRIKARAEHLTFLMEHMEACSVLAHQTKLIVYRAKTDAEGRVWADDHGGSKGYLLPLYAGNGKRVYYVAGAHDGVFQARGRGVAVVDFKAVDAETIEYSGHLFVKVDNAVLAALTKLFQIFIKGQVDKNFAHVMRYPIQLCQWAIEDPQKLRTAIHELPAEDQKKLAPFVEMLPAP